MHAISRLTKETLRESQLRYKEAHDARVREQNRDIKIGDWVYVNKVVVQKGKSPKLMPPVDGPYEVRHVFSHAYKIATANGLVVIGSDRVTKAPIPCDLEAPLPLFSRARGDKEVKLAQEEYQEFVVDRIVSHGRSSSDEHFVRVRWHGFKPSAETWEPTGGIPIQFLKRYAKKKNISLVKVMPRSQIPEGEDNKVAVVTTKDVADKARSHPLLCTDIQCSMRKLRRLIRLMDSAEKRGQMECKFDSIFGVLRARRFFRRQVRFCLQLIQYATTLIC